MTVDERKLRSTADAKVWAEEFVEQFGSRNPGVGTMIGWFANAMETAITLRASEPAKPFEFTREHDGSLSLEAAVMQALGAASACWGDLQRAGVFDSERCRHIGLVLLDFMKTEGTPHWVNRSWPPPGSGT